MGCSFNNSWLVRFLIHSLPLFQSLGNELEKQPSGNKEGPLLPSPSATSRGSETLSSSSLDPKRDNWSPAYVFLRDSDSMNGFMNARGLVSCMIMINCKRSKQLQIPLSFIYAYRKGQGPTSQTGSIMVFLLPFNLMNLIQINVYFTSGGPIMLCT